MHFSCENELLEAKLGVEVNNDEQNTRFYRIRAADNRYRP